MQKAIFPRRIATALTFLLPYIPKQNGRTTELIGSNRFVSETRQHLSADNDPESRKINNRGSNSTENTGGRTFESSQPREKIVKPKSALPPIAVNRSTRRLHSAFTGLSLREKDGAKNSANRKRPVVMKKCGPSFSGVNRTGIPKAFGPLAAVDRIDSEGAAKNEEEPKLMEPVSQTRDQLWNEFEMRTTALDKVIPEMGDRRTLTSMIMQLKTLFVDNQNVDTTFTTPGAMDLEGFLGGWKVFDDVYKGDTATLHISQEFVSLSTQIDKIGTERAIESFKQSFAQCSIKSLMLHLLTICPKIEDLAKTENQDSAVQTWESLQREIVLLMRMVNIRLENATSVIKHLNIAKHQLLAATKKSALAFGATKNRQGRKFKYTKIGRPGDVYFSDSPDWQGVVSCGAVDLHYGNILTLTNSSVESQTEKILDRLMVLQRKIRLEIIDYRDAIEMVEGNGAQPIDLNRRKDKVADVFIQRLKRICEGTQPVVIHKMLLNLEEDPISDLDIAISDDGNKIDIPTLGDILDRANKLNYTLFFTTFLYEMFCLYTDRIVNQKVKSSPAEQMRDFEASVVAIHKDYRQKLCGHNIKENARQFLIQHFRTLHLLGTQYE